MKASRNVQYRTKRNLYLHKKVMENGASSELALNFVIGLSEYKKNLAYENFKKQDAALVKAGA